MIAIDMPGQPDSYTYLDIDDLMDGDALAWASSTLAAGLVKSVFDQTAWGVATDASVVMASPDPQGGGAYATAEAWAIA